MILKKSPVILGKPEEVELAHDTRTMHTLIGAFPEVQVSGVPIPDVLFILPDLRTYRGWRSLPRLLNGKSRVCGEELVRHFSLLPHTPWKEREGISKG